jgi:hypothetical protein
VIAAGNSIENDMGAYGSTLSTSPDKKSFDQVEQIKIKIMMAQEEEKKSPTLQ